MSVHNIAAAVVGRLRWTPVTLLAGVVATAAVAVSMSGTLAAYTASIAHSGNKASTGTLTMRLANGTDTVSCASTDGGGINANTASCVGINHYGGSTLSPGGGAFTSVTVTNTGTVTATGFTLKFGACTPGSNAGANNIAGSATDICSQVSVAANYTINGVTNTVLAGSFSPATLAANAAYTLPSLTPGTSARITFGVNVPSSLGNTYQGLSATQPVTWQFTS